MLAIFMGLLAAFLLAQPPAAPTEDARHFVQQAVQTELAKDEADHSHWLFFEIDQKPVHPVKQWVAETGQGTLRRVLQIDGQPLSEAEQRQKLDAFLSDPGALAKQRKSAAHDDKQATEMLQLLPRAFIWTIKGEQGKVTVLHFKPNPAFDPPDMESKVFAAMEGDMKVDTEQHRIASLSGRMIHDVKIAGGFLGALDAGGSFDVERRETGGGVWQITETHVHIQGRALIFHTISEQEDDVKTQFKELPANITLQQAKTDLLSAQK
ncbi:MAG TPA: hypothetical protein VG225_14600 [Terracidiphilus sp.]|jgi:hypothetical protein|nr:hypothetical protein [Terracidiphilus sp.]